MNDYLQRTYLSETAKWQKVIAVFMTVCAVLLLLISLGCFIAGIVLGFDEPSAFALMIGLFYAPMALLYYFPAKYLFQSAKHLNEWVSTENENALNEGLRNNKSFYKFTGILSIISMASMGIAVIAIIIGGLITAALV